MLFFTYYLTYRNYEDNDRDSLTSAIEEFQKEYLITVNLYSEMATAIFNLEIDREEIISLFYHGLLSSDEVVQKRYIMNLHHYILK